MKENGKVKAIYSWPAIIIFLCVFWPIGLFLLIKRLTLDKKTAMKGGKVVGLLGAICYAMVIIGLIACIGNGFTGSDIGPLLFFAIAGFLLRRVAKKTKKEAEKVKQYLAIIVNGNVRQLDSIAAATGRSYTVVKADIEMMIKKGYLKNAYINENTREVVLPSAAPAAPVATPVAESQPQSVATPVQQQARVVACPCCGANNTIHGATGECEYCGSPIG